MSQGFLLRRFAIIKWVVRHIFRIRIVSTALAPPFYIMCRPNWTEMLMRGLALAFNLLVFLLACTGMMVVFLGGDLSALVVLLALSLPVTLLMSLIAWSGFARHSSITRALPTAWSSVPQWLAVAFWLGIALLLCGELALLITFALADKAPALWQHLPVLAGLSAAIAFLLIDAAGRSRRSAAAP